MLQPKKIKHKKMFRGKIRGSEVRVIELAFGNFGIKALSSGRVTAAQLEATRKTMTKKIKGSEKIWVRFYPSLAVSAKPIEVRMGKGKGQINYWCAQINAGRILFEFQGISLVVANELKSIVKDKLSLNLKLIFLK
jgi:large subunit ribosomal protein L16